jgi:hypothetical protein
MGKRRVGREIRRAARRCDDERRRIRQQLYQMGYPMMSLEQAERVARRITKKQ